MPITLYSINGSPPVRSVLLLARFLDLDLIQRDVDVDNNEHLLPWFKKLNPTHTLPTLNDNGIIVWDSHAILIYLCEKYGKNKNLYPSDLVEKAAVNQVLFFDCGTLFRRFSDAARPIFYESSKTISQQKLDAIEESYKSLDLILQNSKYLASQNITIADISVAATFSSCLLVVPLDENKFKRLNEWFNFIKNQNWYHANLEGLKALEEGFKLLMK